MSLDLLEPFSYAYMTHAIVVCTLVGGVCAFLSSYLILKGWSLMGDALAHAIVPGIALAYILALPYALGAFIAGFLAAFGMSALRRITALREDTIIGLVFTAFFASGLLLASINPMAVDLRAIVLGNILSISEGEVFQLLIICLVCFGILILKWRDFMLIFFDETHAQSIGLPVDWVKILFFTVLSAMTLAALQTVGACLVIAAVITPGATAFLLHRRFGCVIILSVTLGALTGGFGAYLSYFLNAHTGGLIVTLQTAIFLAVFLLSSDHALLSRRKIQGKSTV